MDEHSEPFRSLLQEELAKRLRNNPKYSLRAFAKFLRVEPSFLSKLLTGKRKITKRVVERFSPILGYPTASTTVGTPLAYQDLSVDQFQLIADWYHYAILELADCDSFQPDADWIASQLGISVHESRAAVERLFRLGYLKKTKTGWKHSCEKYTTLSNRFTAPAFRRLQSQILELAGRALEETPFEERHQSSLTIAIHPSQLEEAKAALNAFRRKFDSKLQKSGKSRVYLLSLSFFPVSKTPLEEKTK